MADPQLAALLKALQPIVRRVRTDVTAIKANGRQAWTQDPLTPARLEKHLNGGPARGVCPIKAGEDVTMLGLLDLDSHKGEVSWDDMAAVADQVVGALLMDGMVATPWRSSGGNGIHLIVLWDEPQDAYSVRCALTEAIEACGYTNGAGGIVKRQIEVFPKQDSVPPGGYGNQFVLPLAGKSEPLIPALGYDPGGREAAVGMQWPTSVPVARRERPVRASGEPGGSGNTPRLRAALAAIPNEGEHELDYDAWRNVIFAIHHATDGAGLDLAHEFSARSSKYDGDFLDNRVWPYATAGKGITEASIFAKARDAGWVEDIDAEFDVVEPIEEAGGALAEPEPVFDRETKSGEIKPTIGNVLKALRATHWLGARLGHDQFKDTTMVAWPGDPAWRALRDTDYTRMREVMALRGFKPVSRDMARDAALMVAEENQFDSALQWSQTLRWDGVKRVEDCLVRYFSAENTSYARSVSLYMWTALAGRLLKPGEKADMVPVLVGSQGTGKSTGVAALAPEPDAYIEVNLEHRDDNLARSLRGKLVGELGELRGLQSKDSEAIKAWITRTHEEWVPKYMEFATKFPRRLLFIGTTNTREFLGDETGERRWLPIDVGSVDVPAIERDRDQLWAEAVVLWRQGGVQWRGAMQLAVERHEDFKAIDAWATPVARWLLQETMTGVQGLERPTLEAVAVGALRIDAKALTMADQKRLGRVLRGLGMVKDRATVGGRREVVWVPAENCRLFESAENR